MYFSRRRCRSSVVVVVVVVARGLFGVTLGNVGRGWQQTARGPCPGDG